MSNERIDLTQFEKRENGEYKVEASIGDYTRYMYEDETDIALSKQLNMLPDLITELKRMYEREEKLTELCHEFLGQALTLYDVGNQHKDVDYDYREFNKLRTRFAELLDYGGHKASE